MNSLVGESLPFPKQFVTVEELIEDSATIKFYKARQNEKFFLLKQFKCPEAKNLYSSEVQNLKLANLHGKILQYIDNKDFLDYSLILFDFPARHTLSLVISEDQSLSDPQISTLLRDVLVALFHIHQKKLAHLNICPESIFVTYDYKYKLGNLSYACLESDLKQGVIRIPQEKKPPEVLEYNETALFGSAIDIWAIGCLLYKLVYKDEPFGSNVDHQLRGKTKRSGLQVAEYWRLILNRLLDPNPLTRAKVPEIIILLHESYMPKISFPENTDYIKPSNSFGFSTKSWIRAVTDKNDNPPDPICISKLIGKAWNKPFKIPKAFQELLERPINNDPVVLKCLMVIFRYFSLGPKIIFETEMGGAQFLAEVEKQWKFSTKPKQNSSEDFKNVISGLVDMIKAKLNFHLYTKTSGDWSDLNIIDSSNYELIFFYWDLSIKCLSSLISSPEYLSGIKSIFSGLIIEEQERIMMELSDLAKSGQQVPYKYEEYRNETVRLIERLKNCYPNSSIIKLFTQNSINSISPNSTGRSSESSKSSTRVEDKPLTNSSRGSVMLQSTLLWLIDSAEVKKDKEIGQGSSCSVYRGTYRHTPVAVKVLKTNSKSSVKEFEREVEAMLHLKHPNLILFMGATMGNEMSIVTEFCFGDTVFNLLHEKTAVRISHAQQMKIALDTAKGMAYLHASGLIHRDLKSLNLLLVDPVNSPNDRISVKITDFGISVMFDTDRLMTGQMGTCHWMAPEVLNNEGYDFSADVYSFAIVLWEIFARETPYRNINPAMIPYRVLNLGERPEITKIKNPSIQNLIVKCWTRNKENRPNFPEIIQALEEISIQ